VKFEWDPQKAGLNLKKHGVSFEDAASIFGDPLAGTIPDPEHSTAEPRFITIGVTPGQRVLVVVHTDRAEQIRILSARPATRAETKKYEEAQESSR
jgi:uncharacterized protein